MQAATLGCGWQSLAAGTSTSISSSSQAMVVKPMSILPCGADKSTWAMPALRAVTSRLQPSPPVTRAIEASSAITRTFLWVLRKIWWISVRVASRRGTRMTKVHTHFCATAPSTWLSTSTSIWYWPCSLLRDENSTNTGRQSPRVVRTTSCCTWPRAIRSERRRKLSCGAQAASMPRNSIFRVCRPPAARGSKPLICRWVASAALAACAAVAGVNAGAEAGARAGRMTGTLTELTGGDTARGRETTDAGTPAAADCSERALRMAFSRS